MKKYLKWPAFAVSVAMFVIFTIVLIATCAKDFSKGTYHYEESMAGYTVEIDVTLDDDDYGYAEATITADGEVEYTEIDFLYKVKRGRLFYAMLSESADYQVLGMIDAFEIKLTDEAFDELELKLVATNKAAVATKVVSIVFMSVFAVCALASVGYVYLDKKKSSKPVKEQPVVVENTEQN